MTTNNKPLKDRITLVSLRALSKSCRNPNSEFSVEISETLETLGPKIKNAQNCNLKLVEGALKEAVHFYALFRPNVQMPSSETSQKGRSYGISGNPRRVIQFCKREKMAENCLCNGFFKTYDLIPC
jgi:hypothetical protein